MLSSYKSSRSLSYLLMSSYWDMRAERQTDTLIAILCIPAGDVRSNSCSDTRHIGLQTTHTNRPCNPISVLPWCHCIVAEPGTLTYRSYSHRARMWQVQFSLRLKEYAHDTRKHSVKYATNLTGSQLNLLRRTITEHYRKRTFKTSITVFYRTRVYPMH